MPLVNTLGYEFSLLTSLITSLGAGHLAACYPSRIRNQLARFPGARYPALVMYYRVVSISILILAAPLIISLLSTLWTPPCNQAEGLQFFWAMPGCSAILAVALGLFAGLITPGAITASILWFGLFMGTLASALYTFYASPQVYLYGAFFGYYPGVLYDRLITFELPLVTYRISTLLQTGFLIAFTNWILDPTVLKLSLKRMVKRLTGGLLSCILAISIISFYLAGPTLGHRTGVTELEMLLSNQVQVKGLKLHFPPEADPDLVKELTDDARFSLYRVKSYLSMESDRPISVFFFKNTAQKAKTMGARGTNVAKPWRSEIYVTLSKPPHEILRHELVHAVSRSLGKGPFAIAGSANGLWPNPGLIEGFATAAEGPRTDLTLHQWAASMKKLKLLPSLSNIFGLGFFGTNASSSYTAAGSFCSWVHHKFGKKALRQAYEENSFERATGKKLGDLEKQWLNFLSSVPFTDADLLVAKHRFDRPSVINTVCVHEVSRLNKEANRYGRIGQWDRALETYGQALERSGHSTEAKLRIFFAMVDAKNTDAMYLEASKLLKSNATSTMTKNVIKEILVDDDIANNRLAKAHRDLSDLALESGIQGIRRTLEVKAYLTSHELSNKKILFEILAKRSRRISKPRMILGIVHAVYANPNDPILAYLMARQHFNARDWKVALSWLDKAERLGLKNTIKSVWLAARMIRGKSNFYLGRYAIGRRLFKALENDKDLRLGIRHLAQDWKERCDFFKKHPDRRSGNEVLLEL
jgi:hypothetical protein